MSTGERAGPPPGGEGGSELVQRIERGEETVYGALSSHPAVLRQLIPLDEAAEKDRPIVNAPGAAGEELDVEATERLVARLLRRVAAIAEEHAGRGVRLVDLVRAGNLGLIKAIETFEPHRGVSFSDHARGCIREEIAAALAAHRAEEPAAIKHHRALNPAYYVPDWFPPFGFTDGDDPPDASLDEDDDAGVAARLPSGGAVRRWLRELGRALARTLGEPEPAETPAAEDVSVAEEDLVDELRDAVDHMLDSLPPREELVLRMRFGIGADTGHKAKEVAGWFDVSTSRIHQLQAKALRQLCHKYHPTEVREFLRRLRRLPEA